MRRLLLAPTIATLLLLVACWDFGGMEMNYDLDPSFSVIEIHTGAGSIDVMASGGYRLEADFHRTEDENMLTMEYVGETLIVTSECMNANCHIDLDIDIPPGVQVIAKTASGDIDVQEVEAGAILETADGMVRVTDIEGGLDVITASGDVDLLDIDCDVFVNTVDGSIDGSDMTSDHVLASSTSGKVMFELKTPPQEVVIETISSGVDLTVPVDAYDLDLESMSGSVSIYDLEDSDGAPQVISIHSTSGSISVTGD